MCGICGIYNFNKKPVKKPLLSRMASEIKHRGPDNEGFFFDQNVGLGYRRLTIIDTTEQPQPILHNEDQTIWISFNGEIYNFHELRDDLVKKGHKFYTATDTEAIVHLYEEYGLKFVRKLNGMFAFAIWDAKKQKLILARDQVGIKPLYYAQTSDFFIFCSEIKGILASGLLNTSVDQDALSQYFNFRYVPSPLTMFEGILKIPPGNLVEIQGGEVKSHSFWDFSFNPSNDPEEIFTRHVRTLLDDSIKRQMIADVPLGAFLSGGIDSSIVIARMSEFSNSPVKTFSVGFSEEKYSELSYAKEISELYQTDHHEIIVKPSDTKLLPKIVWHLDEPLADPASLPTYLLSQEAAKKVKVVLTGEGSDELFGGYRRDLASPIAPMFAFLPAFSRRGFSKALAKLPDMRGKSLLVRSPLALDERAHDVLRNIFKRHPYPLKESSETSLDLVRNLLEKTAGWDYISKMLYLETKIWLEGDPLMKVDKMTMANSLESRVPFLDPRLIEYAATIPSKYKFKSGTTKYILRQAMRDVLPDAIFTRKKQAFEIPIRPWLQGPLRKPLREILSPSIKKIGYLDSTAVETLLSQHLSGTRDHSAELWALLNFVLWHRIYIDHEKITSL